MVWGGYSGSSPLARGTLETTPPARSPRPVHPRSRGEHYRRLTEPQLTAGSSPLARGTRPASRCSCFHRRFIPARAGNTWMMPLVPSISTVHPRSRGEHDHHQDRTAGVCGSSPLARGTRHDPFHVGGRTPVHPRSRRGTPRPRREAPPAAPVHPRSRGEHGRPAPLDHPPGRFIPARAGNTRGAHRSDRRCPVHPRSRGEHLDGEDGNGVEYGSSPLARGTPRGDQRVLRPNRFIPARAGNTGEP